jgi:hypothetical protein
LRVLLKKRAISHGKELSPMKAIIMPRPRWAAVAIAAVSLGLAGCNDPTDDALEQQADTVEQQSEAAAEQMEERADTMTGAAEDTLENKAEAVEQAGEAKAEKLEEKADRVEDKY